MPENGVLVVKFLENEGQDREVLPSYFLNQLGGVIFR